VSRKTSRKSRVSRWTKYKTTVGELRIWLPTRKTTAHITTRLINYEFINTVATFMPPNLA